ncbi:hypothetical protein LB941_05430 [Ligilactobacillus sp. WILCCON 0076]|uniref:Uncharacterized protein n=1 Tax=Ligilactobacillus ubinensis TaxID=2876789 RepID=A0A9X2FKC1_9LACO|nr:hypothetical protein [Ligilactobacillus ubinensis]MCP0886779.1 hypothetical protein [Ligilactobacillus ubinensis]
MFAKYIEFVIYALLIILTVYNIRLNMQMMKFKRKENIRTPDELNQIEGDKVNELTKNKKKWTVLGQLIFLFALYMAIVGTVVELAFFLDLYTVTTIVNNKLTYQILKFLIAEK